MKKIVTLNLKADILVDVADTNNDGSSVGVLALAARAEYQSRLKLDRFRDTVEPAAVYGISLYSADHNSEVRDPSPDDLRALGGSS